MTTGVQSVCSLCRREVPRAELQEHIQTEHPFLRHDTIKLIQAYHPGWQEEQGACWSCWKAYRQATQMLHVLKASSPVLSPRR